MSTVRDTDKGARALATRLHRAAGSRVKVGVLDDAPKEEGEGRAGGALSLVEVAALHEFGAPPHIPQRSFVRAGVDENLPEIRRVQHALAVQVFKGSTELPVALDRLGAKVAALLQNRIARGIAPENAPSTIARKESSTPLVDTGQLRASITWKVEA
jgi:phage gpG-like protein